MVEARAGVEAGLTGPSGVKLQVEHLVVGAPSYLASYRPTRPGPYSLAVRQLTPGGLVGEYFDNQWFRGPASLVRIDS